MMNGNEGILIPGTFESFEDRKDWPQHFPWPFSQNQMLDECFMAIQPLRDCCSGNCGLARCGFLD